VRAALVGCAAFLVKPLSRGDVARAIEACGIFMPKDERPSACEQQHPPPQRIATLFTIGAEFDQRIHSPSLLSQSAFWVKGQSTDILSILRVAA
jgi:hypothetical protein